MTGTTFPSACHTCVHCGSRNALLTGSDDGTLHALLCAELLRSQKMLKLVCVGKLQVAAATTQTLLIIRVDHGSEYKEGLQQQTEDEE